MKLVKLLTLALFLISCGKKMAPVSPDAVLPAAVRQFQVAQEGPALMVSWLLPQENLLGQPLSQISGCLLYRAEVPGVVAQKGCLPEFHLLADIDLAYPRQGKVEGEKVSYRDSNLLPTHRYFYRVAAYYDPAYPGAWSPVQSHAWASLPQAPGALDGQAGDKAAYLSWPIVSLLQNGQPARDIAGYHLYRRSPQEDWRLLTPEPIRNPPYEDLALTNDVPYTYRVRAVRRLGPDLLASLDSPPCTVAPVDLTPPPPPLNLVAVPTVKGVELRWEPNPAPDLAGYLVYRRPTGAPQFALLTPELLKNPYFVDSQVAKGQSYHYYVTAVDNAKRPNESPPSEEIEVTF